MAWDDEIQKTKSILGDVGSVIEQGLGIFTRVKETVMPTAKSTPDVYEPKTATKGPVTSQPAVQGISGMFAGMDIKTLGIIAVIGYMLLASRK